MSRSSSGECLCVVCVGEGGVKPGWQDLLSCVTDFELVRSAYVIAASLPKPDIIPSVHADFGPYLSFDLNIAAIWVITTELYYFILTPGVTVSVRFLTPI